MNPVRHFHEGKFSRDEVSLLVRLVSFLSSHSPLGLCRDCRSLRVGFYTTIGTTPVEFISSLTCPLLLVQCCDKNFRREDGWTPPPPLTCPLHHPRQKPDT